MNIYKELQCRSVIESALKRLLNTGFIPAGEKIDIKLDLLPYRRIGPNSTINIRVTITGNREVVIKMPRFIGTLASDSIKKEYETIKSIDSDPILGSHTAEVLDILEVDGADVLITKAIRGEMLHAKIDKEEDLSAIGAVLSQNDMILAAFSNIRPSGPIEINGSFFEEHIFSPLKVVFQYYPRYMDDIQNLVSLLLQRAGSERISVPLIFNHGDYNPWNILLNEDKNYIVFDWEDATAKGLPLFDLYNFYVVLFRIMLVGETPGTKKRTKEAVRSRVDFVLGEFRKSLSRYESRIPFSRNTADILFAAFIIRNTSLFLEEKRRDVSYGESWISLLATNACKENLFETSVYKATEAFLDNRNIRP